MVAEHPVKGIPPYTLKSNHMKSIRVHQFGGRDALKVEDIAVPEPQEGEARVKIEVIGVNFLDIYQRMGRYQGSMPFTLGQEAAGVVDAVGPNVTDVKVGDRVAYASVQGSYTEYAVVPAWRLVLIPNGVDFQQAAAAMVQGICLPVGRTSCCSRRRTAGTICWRHRTRLAQS